MMAHSTFTDTERRGTSWQLGEHKQDLKPALIPRCTQEYCKPQRNNSLLFPYTSQSNRPPSPVPHRGRLWPYSMSSRGTVGKLRGHFAQHFASMCVPTNPHHGSSFLSAWGKHTWPGRSKCFLKILKPKKYPSSVSFQGCDWHCCKMCKLLQ